MGIILVVASFIAGFIYGEHLGYVRGWLEGRMTEWRLFTEKDIPTWYRKLSK